ncbi:MAG: hypothetical protein ACRDZ3_15805, partial [Acidimicrobiia bacterium]
MRSRLRAVMVAVIFGAVSVAGAGCAGDDSGRATLRFGVGPLLPTTTDTVAAWRPFFAWLAEELDVDFELRATN